MSVLMRHPLEVQFITDSKFRLSQNHPKRLLFVSLHQICKVFDLKFLVFLIEVNVICFFPLYPSS